MPGARRSSGPPLAPLIDAFRARGLTPPPLVAGEGRAAQVLLQHYTPDQIADCWAAIQARRWGDRYLQTRPSFKLLLSQNWLYGWLQAQTPPPAPPGPASRITCRCGLIYDRRRHSACPLCHAPPPDYTPTGISDVSA